MPSDQIVRPYYVSDGDLREIEEIWSACFRVDCGRARRTIWRAKHVGTDHEILFSVEKLARTYKFRPPVLCVGVCGKRMTDPYHLASVSCLPWVLGSVICYLETADASSCLEFE